MKNLTFFITLLFSALLSAQNFPGTNTQLLLNREVKVLDTESAKQYGYREFYKDKALNSVYACCQGRNAKYEKLVNRLFKVVEITPVQGFKSSGGTKFALTLKDESEIIYFNYDSQYEFSFPFEVIGGIEIPDEYYCEFVKEEKSVTSSGNVLVSDTKEGIFFFKMNSNGTDTYLVNITVPSDKVVPVGKGASIELENGYVITMPNVSVKAIDNGYGGKAYSATLALLEKDIEMLKTSKIVNNTVNGISTSISQGYTHRGIFRCIAGKSTKSLCDIVNKHEDTDFYLYAAAVEDVALFKFIEKTDLSVSYQFKITVQDNELRKDIPIAQIILENDKVIKKANAKIDVKTLSNGMYEYSTFLDLTKEEATLLRQNKVEAALIYSLYTRVKKGDTFMELINCVENKSALNL